MAADEAADTEPAEVAAFVSEVAAAFLLANAAAAEAADDVTSCPVATRSAAVCVL